jgi:outer membrane protein
MKKIAFVLILLMGGLAAQAQKVAYVDIKKILNSMDEYKAAKAEVDQLSAKWQKELEAKYASIEKLYSELAAEEVLLPEDIKKQRKDAIFEAERQAKEYKKEKFGYDGELYKVQDQKIQPIQDRIYEAVEKMALEKKLDIIFDKSANSGMIYTNALFDRTEDVMGRLGIKPK